MGEFKTHAFYSTVAYAPFKIDARFNIWNQSFHPLINNACKVRQNT